MRKVWVNEEGFVCIESDEELEAREAKLIDELLTAEDMPVMGPVAPRLARFDSIRRELDTDFGREFASPEEDGDW